MDLWTEFEGVTIDQSFALNKLLQTEGRSAFFSTRNASGEPVLIRIIECHFDEDEILARWRGVQTLGHASFLRIEHFGQFLIEADDITAVYAVFERVDANLGEVLERGRLPGADAAQIGVSIASALEMLHTNGFVHEHVEARNIYAVGETVKLRSDCIRETPEGEAGLAARRRDVHDLAVALMQVLLGDRRATEMPGEAALPAPFDEIVRNGISGEWELAEIQAALARHKGAKGAAQKAVPTKAAVINATASAETMAQGKSGEMASAPEMGAQPEREFQARFQPQPEPWAEWRASRASSSEQRAPFPGRERPLFELSRWLSAFRSHPRQWVPAGALILVVVLLGWMFVHRVSGHRASAAAEPVAAARTASSASSVPAAAQHERVAAHAVAAAGVHASKQWRVVAFTYNREDQARKKASSLAQKHPDLRAEVFTPTGRAPWLVTIGGTMGHDDAYALARKARSLGLPRDAYAQNYTAH